MNGKAEWGANPIPRVRVENHWEERRRLNENGDRQFNCPSNFRDIQSIRQNESTDNLGSTDMMKKGKGKRKIGRGFDNLAILDQCDENSSRGSCNQPGLLSKGRGTIPKSIRTCLDIRSEASGFVDHQRKTDNSSNGFAASFVGSRDLGACYTST